MNMLRLQAVVLGLGLCNALLDVQGASEDISKLPPAATQSGVTYEKDIKAILNSRCLYCHRGDKPKAGLQLDTLDGVIKGSKDGPVVVPGQSAKSKIVLSVARLNDDNAMPPEGKGKPLTKQEVGLIRAWIDQGAK
jgi:hypothetical protein